MSRAAASAPPQRLSTRVRRPGEALVTTLLTACGGLTVLTTLGIVLVLVVEGAAFLRDVPLSRVFFDTQWTPLFTDQRFGIWPLVAGTFLTSVLALLVAVPFGLLAAIYLAEIASPRVRAILKPSLELLAGIPTLVYGLLALTIVTPFLQTLIPDLAGFNALSPGLVMGIMILPMVSSLAEDAIGSVPRSLREGAYALGAGRVETIVRVVLPSARSGIVAAITLALGRAVGETMIVAVAAGMQPRLTLDPRVPIETMTAYIVQVATGDVPQGTVEHRAVFAVAAVLLLMTAGVNLIARRMTRNRAAEAM